MRHLICLEASHQRGMGHLFRGLNLARFLRSLGDNVVIAVNEDERAIDLILSADFPIEIYRVFSDEANWEESLISKHAPDWWINDRLHTNLFHSNKITSSGVRLATFDDHGEGAVLAEYNFLAMDLWPTTNHAANALYGPDYMILNPIIGNHRGKRKRCSPPGS